MILVLLLIMQRMKGFESDGYRTVSGLSHPLRSGMDAHTSDSLNEVKCL